MTGYSPRELSKKICTLDNLLYVEDFTEVIASMNYQLSISNLISIQHRIVTKSGTVLTVLCNGQAFSLNDGRDVLQCVLPISRIWKITTEQDRPCQDRSGDFRKYRSERREQASARQQSLSFMGK